MNFNHPSSCFAIATKLKTIPTTKERLPKRNKSSTCFSILAVKPNNISPAIIIPIDHKLNFLNTPPHSSEYHHLE